MTDRRARRQGFRPGTEGLESRRLLSATFRGTDIDGDTYTLRLAGTGDLRVTLVDVDGEEVLDASQPALIDSITIGGADPTSTRLVGRVNRGPNGDGRVFFQTLDEVGGPAENAPGNLGILAVDLPDFWLGATNPDATGADPSISIPDGIITLRFGGVDTTFDINRDNTLAPDENNQNDQFNINLGLPRTRGTSIIVDRVISSAQAASTPTGQPTRDTVTFSVAGRLNLFQANAIEGNADIPATGFQGGGGTLVISLPDQATGITGAIGTVRVLGNATNFAAQTNDRINTFHIGGEATNVSLLAPIGARHVFFGRGMDTVSLRSATIRDIQANRGAINSSVTTERGIGSILIGGDVVDTRVLSGYAQDLATVFQTQQAPDDIPPVQVGGTIHTVRIAGDVMDSVFAASVDPTNGIFGDDDDLVLPHAVINARVEGAIVNATDITAFEDEAFFALETNLNGGPVVPPDVAEPPFPNADAPPSGPRVVKGLQPPTTPQDGVPRAAAQVRARRASTRARRLG